MNKDEFVEQAPPPSSQPYKSETRQATYKDKEWWNRFCSLFWIYLILFVAIIAGCVCLPLGVKFKKQIKTMDASIDFKFLEGQCMIEQVNYIKQIQKTGDKGRHEGCDDIWELVFDASVLSEEDSFYENRDDYSFTGIDLRVSRDCKSCNRCNKKDPGFFVGMEADCWRPTVPDISTEEGKLNEWYRCGNEDCIKILSPEKDVERAKGISGALFIAGIVCIAAGVPCIVGLFLADKTCIPEATVEEQVYNAQPNQPTVQDVPPNNATAPSYASQEENPNDLVDSPGPAANNSGEKPSLFDQLQSKV